MKRNKITIGKLANTIEIRKPVTMEEWEKVRGRIYTPTNTVEKEKVPAIPADPTDEEVLLLAKHNIARLEPKFREGMEKYSTPIFQKSGLKEMLPEILDLISYHAVAQLQWSKVYRCLDELCEAKPELSNNPLVVKLFEILGDKPLAVKKKNTSKEYMPGVWYTNDGSDPKPTKKKTTKKKK